MKKLLFAAIFLVFGFAATGKPARADVIGVIPCPFYQLVIDLEYNPRYDIGVPIYGQTGCLFVLVETTSGCNPDGDDDNPCYSD
jgi:hypothetical protein